MTRRLESKVVVVTGGSSGIGRAVAQRAASEGAAVVIGARRKDAGEAAAGEIRAAGGRSQFVATDVTAEADAAALIGAAMTELGRLDGAFNNAGDVSATGPLHELAAQAWRTELDQNLNSVFCCMKAQIPASSPELPVLRRRSWQRSMLGYGGIEEGPRMRWRSPKCRRSST